MTDDRCLLLFTKPARPGRVKTRLVGELSAEQAADLHQAFLDDVTTRLAGGSFRLVLAWAIGPGEALPAPPEPGLRAVRQRGEALGERLYEGLADAARDHRYVMALGSDHPLVARARIEEGFEHLEAGCGVVLGPAEDGGYYLIGVDRERLTPDLFRDVPWSTDRVLATTLERCREQGVRPHLLPEGWDVDTPCDLARLADLMIDGHRGCPRTRLLLARWGRVPVLAEPVPDGRLNVGEGAP